VHLDESLGYYIVDLVSATREAPAVQVGASPRGTLALMKLARAKAALSGRDYVVPEDVKAVAVPALAHRLTLRPELWVQRVRADDIVRELLDQVPTPAVEPPGR
jgi:MoxR-like ATPase